MTNDGIVETINKKFANLYTTNKEYAAYDKNHSLQFVGLDFDSATVSAQETNKISGDKNEQIPEEQRMTEAEREEAENNKKMCEGE